MSDAFTLLSTCYNHYLDDPRKAAPHQLRPSACNCYFYHYFAQLSAVFRLVLLDTTKQCASTCHRVVAKVIA